MRTLSRYFYHFVVAGMGGLAVYLAMETFPLSRPVTAAPPEIKIDERPLARETKMSTSFAPVVREVAPSVVSVSTTRTVTTPGRQAHPFFDDPIFRRFFGEPEGRMEPRERQRSGLGSGLIVSENGYILTNNHVVDGADEIRVSLPGTRQEFVATVVGTDPPTDIAVLKVEANGLPAATMTNSDDLEVGDVVLAIGNPFGVGQTVTMGIVSAKGRGINLMEYEDFIQTDASINPGNSGGPLVDAEGRVVGINTAIFTRTGGSQGIGFAVPVNLARYVMDQIVAVGEVTRGYLGVRMQPEITADLAREFGLPSLDGVLISDVLPDTPAEKAGLQPGDAIVEYDGRPVVDNRNLRLMVSQTQPGREVELTIIRQKKERTITVELEELPPEGLAQLGEPRRDPGLGTGAVFRGVEVADLDQQSRREFDIPANVRGALVKNVEQNSAAWQEGLRSGDVILEMNHQRVETARDAIDLSRQTESDRVLLRVWSGGGTRFLVLDAARGK